jgi:hypothetical protein
LRFEANLALSCVPSARRWPLRLFIPNSANGPCVLLLNRYLLTYRVPYYGQSGQPIGFPKFEHGEGGAGVGFAPGRDAIVAGDIVKVIFFHEEGNKAEDRLKLGLGINFPFLPVPRFAATLAAIAMRSGYCRTVRIRLPHVQLLVKGSVHSCVRDFYTDAD